MEDEKRVLMPVTHRNGRRYAMTVRAPPRLDGSQQGVTATQNDTECSVAFIPAVVVSDDSKGTQFRLT